MSASANGYDAGFIGLGNMGRPMAGQLAAAGFRLMVYDVAGTKERAPDGAAIAGCTAEVAAAAPILLLSLPDGAAVAAVLDAVLGAPGRVTTAVIDLSTIGVAAARANAARLAAAGIGYLDAPVSGGVVGARARTISVMCAGEAALAARSRPLLEALSPNVFLVGEQPGQGQALKVLNNFLSATALAATSEAVAFGVRAGLNPARVIEVLNASSGRNSATAGKFPRDILTGTYAGGFTNTLMAKDLRLYLAASSEVGARHELGDAASAAWEAFRAAAPGADFTRIYPYLAGEE